MVKNEILNQIKESQKLLDKLEDIMISIKVDMEYLQSEIDLEEVKEALVYAIRPDDWDINCPHDISYQNEPEKREILFNGVKQGYSAALFWMTDYFGLVEFFEEKIGHNFENLDKGET